MKDIFYVAEQEGLYFIAPMSAQNNGKYLIQCRSRAEADRTIREINTDRQPTPLEDESAYVKLGNIPGTPIYQNKE